MSESSRFADLYQPTHDELARQQFVGALKGYLNGPIERDLAASFERDIAPRFRARAGRDPEKREDVAELFAEHPLYQLWGAAVYESQDLMWETVDETCRRLLPELERRFDALDDATRLGSLELDDSLKLPEPIRSVEIHRQPGGYFAEPDAHGLLTALRYFGTVELYRAAKGLSTGAAAGEPGMGHYILAAVKRRFGDLAPKRILDLGCGPGTETIAYKQAFPDAEVWGIDLSAPFLRFAHVWAEDLGVPIHYRQADARDTGFEEGSFDLIVSNIVFHETGDDILPGVLAEARRLLAPGGVMLHVDVPFQVHRTPLTKQVTNHWQVINNGEPYWSGFANLDVGRELGRAGFDPEGTFVDYDPLGDGHMLVFGARGPM